MNPHVQEKKVNYKAFLESFKITQKDFLKIMEDDDVNSRNTGIKNLGISEIDYDFSIDSNSFIPEIVNTYNSQPIEIKEKLEYLKIYFIQNESSEFSIGFTISSEKDNSFGDNDFFFMINSDNKLKKIEDKKVFEQYTSNYKNQLLKIINSKTKIDDIEMHNTEVIYYKLKDVFTFIISHFLNESKYSKLFFQMIIFEKTLTEEKNRNRLSLVVRATNSSKSKTPAYDFGTVYP